MLYSAHRLSRQACDPDSSPLPPSKPTAERGPDIGPATSASASSSASGSGSGSRSGPARRSAKAPLGSGSQPGVGHGLQSRTQTQHRDSSLQSSHLGSDESHWEQHSATRQDVDTSMRGADASQTTDLSRVVINMYEFYASELEMLNRNIETVGDQLQLLRQDRTTLQQKMDVHAAVLQGAFGLMRVMKGDEVCGSAQQQRQIHDMGDMMGTLLGDLATSSPSSPSSSPTRRTATVVAESNSAVKTESPPSASALPSPELTLSESSGSLPSVAKIITKQHVSQGTDLQRTPPSSIDFSLPPTPVAFEPSVTSTGRRATTRRPPSTRKAVYYNDDDIDAAMDDVEFCPETRELRINKSKPKSKSKSKGKKTLQSNTARNRGSRARDTRATAQARWKASKRRSTWTAVNSALLETTADASTAVAANPDADSNYAPESEVDDYVSMDDDPVLNRPDVQPSPQKHQRRRHQERQSASPQHMYAQTTPKPRYAHPRRTTARYASGPSHRPFRYHRMGRTVSAVWHEWHHGSHGNPPIASLEEEFGTGWRTGNLRDIKYGSNYVGVRLRVVRQVEDLCEQYGWTPEEACDNLDARVDGRMQLLIGAVRAGKDPFEVIPRKK